ncbi:ketopantoate reductase PanE/ApbA C terminal-domain-containing protein [Phialemonium atrogriseum]|uniref:Ketopantoate reductase PanE/ApbA C terminal-domain-containing protein n=1 Tax=Phialemonium atrogriseum TaxID=1093897 RepID=A0AAJ0FMZ9_9PEZI|nr:ketopantoate reductase PanE/ApbA C terminal-domain-containing protein [Phialemonium atrogriseum]KAK1768778.1 ketopantoate reductase PanE/ApbA C terminal-domain-containing protein [Phialemonium atrogriseum]
MSMIREYGGEFSDPDLLVCLSKFDGENKQQQELGPFSDQIHILGSDVQGRYFTHALASCKYLPPVRFLLHRRAMQRIWEDGGRCIHLYRGEEYLPNARAVAELVQHQDFWSGKALSGQPVEHIHQLIITVPASSVVRAFASIRDRVDARTSICLVQDGLGVVEALNETYFPDPTSRPAYLLGHMTHQLYPVQDSMFSLSEVKQGRLYLSALRGDLGHSRIRYHPPVERWSKPGHFLGLLTSTPGLQAGGFPLEKFLNFKLPSTVFKSVVDPLTVILDCTYDKLAGNTYARQMMDQLLGEILNVVARLPELRGYAKFNDLRGGGLRKDVFERLARKKDGDSRMRSLIRRGWEGDIDFLNGYFVKRGREVGVKCPANETVIWMVKARHAAQLAQRREEIAFER